jgi:hypothetical protein
MAAEAQGPQAELVAANNPLRIKLLLLITTCTKPFGCAHQF